MITLVGVGHVFAISEGVKALIRSRHPEIVCLELDVARFNALSQKQHSHNVPLQYRLLAYFQKRMASKFDTEVGGEMLAAAEAAREIGARLALIDMDASSVFANMWRKMSMRERLTLLTGAFAGLFISKERVEEEVQKFESQEDQYIQILSEGFPTVKKVLIDDRNKYMAERLLALSKEHPAILAVVGDGHVPGLVQLLTGAEVEVIRLKDLLKEPRPQPKQGGSEYSSSFWYHTGS